MGRFIEADESVVEVFLDTIEKRFPSLIQFKFKLVFDLKRRVKQGEICLASVELTSEKVKFFSKDNIATEGYDVVLIFDKKAWEVAGAADRIRIMSHELRHVFVDENGKVKLLPHDISDFRIEQKLNTDDPDWRFKLGTLVSDIYEQEKEMAKQKNDLTKEYKHE